MKRCISMFLAVLLLLTCLPAGMPTGHAAEKTGQTRAIAIVFDNSGSMYIDNNRQAWCRATYAMEVFASMLNDGDVLQIYPMWPITVGGEKYSMDKPLEITDAAQASTIRDIFTDYPGGTPIESIDCAAAGLQSVQADKKYMIVLTDGGTFSLGGSDLVENRTKEELDNRVKKYAGPEMTVMYLGVGQNAAIPDTAESAYFAKEKVVDSQDVLSTLTVMCNQVFGRDTLPKNHISGKQIEIDISMSKMIVFVQGEDISNLKLTGSAVGKKIGEQKTQYSTRGTSKYPSVPDTSLQGMMVTYADCGAGTYNIEYSGTATSVEVYYEPDADLAFVFTDANGNTVDPNALYEGDYKVSFGMMDGKTGKLIESDLLGNPQYNGFYYINGESKPIERSGFSGSVDVPLKVGDTFDANLTVTYLSGYTITKDSSDFGWGEGGIEVVPKTAGTLKLEITGGDKTYELQTLEEGSPYIAKVYHDGTLLTGEKLESVDLRWEPEKSNAEIKKQFKDDHWELYLLYKDPDAPESTACGECTVTIFAHYNPRGSLEATAECPLTYTIKDNAAPLQMELVVPESYIVIKNLADTPAITANLKMNGAPLSAEMFANVTLQVDCGGIEHTVTANPQDSSYSIKLLSTAGIKEGDYPVKVTAVYTDQIGRVNQAEESASVTLSSIPLWMRWAVGLALLLLLLLIIWLIMHIKVLPKHANTSKKLSNMVFDGETVPANYAAEVKKKGARAQAQFAGRKIGLSMNVSAGPESYLYKSSKRRSALVKPDSVKKFGPAKIQEAMIGSAKYVLDEDKGKLVPAIPNQKPFLLTNGTTIRYSGTIQDAGIDKDFEVTSKLNFKKK